MQGQHLLPVSVAQLDVSPTGDQEVAGSTTARCVEIMKYFLVILSLPLIQEAVVSFW